MAYIWDDDDPGWVTFPFALLVVATLFILLWKLGVFQ